MKTDRILKTPKARPSTRPPGGAPGGASIVQYSIVQYSIVQYSIVQCSIVQCSVVQYSVVQCSVVQYSIVHYVILYSIISYGPCQPAARPAGRLRLPPAKPRVQGLGFRVQGDNSIHVNNTKKNTLSLSLYIYIYVYTYIRIWFMQVFYIPGVLEAPIPNMSLGDKTSLHVISISSDKQQLSHNIGDNSIH